MILLISGMKEEVEWNKLSNFLNIKIESDINV